MTTFQDVWNEIDRRDQATLEAALSAMGFSTDAPTGGTPPSSGGLPIHGNLHHMPPLAIASDLAAHIATIASAGTLGHIRIGDGLAIDIDGIVSVDTGSLEIAFLDLTDTPGDYTGQANKVVRVKADVSGLEFHTLTAADVGALTQVAADALYLGLSSVSAFGLSLIDDANAATARATLELVAGAPGDIWVDEAGDTMSGALIIALAGAGPGLEVSVDDSTTFETVNVTNSNAGTSAGAGILFEADTGDCTFFMSSSTYNVITDAANKFVINTGTGVELLFRTASSGLNTEFRQGSTTSLFLGNTLVGMGTNNPATSLEISRTTGPVVRLSRNDTIIAANDVIGRLEFSGNDSDLSTQGVFGNIEVQAQATIASDAAFGKMLLRTTGPGAATSPVDRLALGCVETLTDAATNLFDVTLAAGQMAGGTVVWTIQASNGTDHQSYSGITTYAVVNKAGAYTTQITHNTANDSKAVSSGTLTAAWTVLNGTNKVTIRVTPTGSLTETIYQILYSVHSNSPQAITIL